MKIPVLLKTASGAIIRRNMKAVTAQKAASLGMKPITEPQAATSLKGATFVARRFSRPPHVPVYGGCKPDCGHTDAEHICFDAGVHDGSTGRNAAEDASIPIAEMSIGEFGAWQSGWTVGRMNRRQKAASGAISEIDTMTRHD